MILRRLSYVGVLVLAGCAIGPDYEEPEVPVPEAYREPVESGKSIANLRWWELFQNDDLNELIEVALENNKDLDIALARVEEVRARLGFVRADQWPQLGGGAGAQRGNTIPGTQVPTGASVENLYVLGASLSFEIDIWGKLRRATEAARADLLATTETRNVVIITLVSDVASVYLLLLDLDERLVISARTVETRLESLRIIQARYDMGTVPLIDVNQAQVELFDAEAELVSVERERQQAENLLSVLIGQNPGPIIRNAPGNRKLFPPVIPVGLPSDLLARRPDVRQASQQLASETAQIGVAMAQRLPSLSLTGLLGLASNDLSELISSDNEAWNIGAQLAGPIFDAGKTKSQVEAQRARAQAALANYELTVLRAFQEVEDSLVAIRTYRAEALAREKQVEAALSGAELSRARYDGGVTSYLEVLESERSLFRAELTESATRREQLVSVVTLYKALGGGWIGEEEAAQMEAENVIEANQPPEPAAQTQ
ncbi:MAG: efflux transporter outer membrane subunit [Gammaproteobacteria bacterium]